MQLIGAKKDLLQRQGCPSTLTYADEQEGSVMAGGTVCNTCICKKPVPANLVDEHNAALVAIEEAMSHAGALIRRLKVQDAELAYLTRALQAAWGACEEEHALSKAFKSLLQFNEADQW